MGKQKHQTHQSTRGVEHLSFTLEEIMGDAGVTNFEHTSADGRRVHRRTHRLQPLSPIKNSDSDSTNFPTFQENLYESFDTPEFDSFGGQADFEPVEFETPRAKQYLSSVRNCIVFLFGIVIYLLLFPG